MCGTVGLPPSQNHGYAPPTACETRAVDQAVTIDRELLVRPAAQQTTLGHALNLLAGAAVRFRESFGRSDPVWSLIGFFADGRLLAARRPPLRS